MKRVKKIIPDRLLPEPVRFFYGIEFLLKLLFPVCCITGEYVGVATPVDPGLIAKWFIFWGLGIYLPASGIMQLTRPRFAAFQTNRLSNPGNNEMAQQLGILIISTGALGVFSLFNEPARQTAAVMAIVYFGLTTVWHFFRKANPTYEMVGLVTDLLLFSTSLLYLFFRVFFKLHL